MVRFFVFVPFLFPAWSLANGGPVAWSGGTARGGVAPLQSSQVELLEESLELKLLPDRKHFAVKAEYRLRNPGPETEVEYGVPITWADEGGKTPPSAEGKEAAKSVRLRLLKKEYGCRYEPVVASTDQIGWCVTKLTLPKGDLKLELTYRAELEFTDYEYSSSALTQFSPRVLRYPLFPAGYWKGNPSSVKVRVDLGPYLGEKPPEYAKRVGDTWIWEWKEPDLKKKKEIRIELSARAQVAEQLVRWNLRPYGKVEYQQDSGLAPLFDGKPETAWCAKGPTPSFELSARPEYSPESYCHFEGLAFSPGHLKNDAAYRSHGRVKHVRVSGCGGDPRAKMDFYFHDLDPREEATQFLAIPYGHPLAEAYRCLKVEILATDPAAPGETCVSEVAGVMGCG